MNRSGNIRSQNTRKLIEDTYLSLLNRDPSHTVSVTMLCQETGLNRATFYAHFDDIHDLQEKLEAKTTQDLITIFKDKGLGESKMSLQRIATILDYIKDHRMFYEAYYRTARMDRPSAVDLIARKNGSDSRSRYRIIFYQSGISSIIMDWIFRSCEDPVEIVASVIMELYGN